MSEAETPQRPGRSGAWRSLGWFWAVVIVLVACCAGLLQVLGPPAPPPPVQRAAATPPAAAAVLPPLAVPGGARPPAQAVPPSPAAPAGTAAAGPIPAPMAELEEPSKDYPGHFLPRISDDRRSPMQAYAAATDPAERRPRIAILLAGIGMSQNDSEEAVADLPAAMSLAVSPYAYRPEALLAQARARGHETLVSIPMEPQGYPLDDPGNRALMTGNSAAENAKLLDWALSRFGGFVGATGALGPSLNGERFASSPAQMDPVLTSLAARGLLYIDPRPGDPRPPGVVGRSADVVIDEPAVRTAIEAKLARLEQIAHDRGSAIGLAESPRPVTIDRLVAWSNTLASRGFALMPVSAVAPIVPPPAPPSSAEASGASAP